MTRFLRSALLLFALACGTPALADTLPPPRLGVVDLHELSQKSLATIDLDNKVEAAKKEARDAVHYKSERLQEDLRTFRVESASLSPEEAARRQADLEKRVSELAGEEKQAVAAIEARGAKAMEGVQAQFRDIVKTVAEGMTLDMVVEKQVYDQLVADHLAAPDAQDVTSLVLVFLNQKIKSIDLPPAEGTAQP
ncbi:MAG: hypothetical protein GC201_17565 [Alphaproteobacteria bacterium]|nr:hypothetical protein [Alphaproteobacteria bacterium]